MKGKNNLKFEKKITIIKPILRFWQKQTKKKQQQQQQQQRKREKKRRERNTKIEQQCYKKDPNFGRFYNKKYCWLGIESKDEVHRFSPFKFWCHNKGDETSRYGMFRK